VLERNIRRDPMTKLKNYIQFIEEDFNVIFGDKGYFIIFDLANFKAFNESHGRVEGDVVLIKLAMILKRAINPVHIYRMEGDAFLIILKEVDKLSTEIIKKRIIQHFSDLQSEYPKGDLGLHYALYGYASPIKSVSDYYGHIVNGSDHNNSDKFVGKQLIEHIVIGVTNRLKESVSYYNDIYQFAIFDDVSKLPNSKAARSYLSRLRLDHPFSIAFIDGDDLSRYNAISYDTGNEVIAHLGQVISDSVRADDRVFRWLSGDEFIVVFHHVDLEQSINLCERIRLNIHSSKTYDLSASIGVVHYPTDGHALDDLIRKSEEANRTAKRRGKNRVVSWQEVDEKKSIRSEIT
jgi:diguanylate cyclase (GGDEF)-like protein